MFRRRRSAAAGQADESGWLDTASDEEDEPVGYGPEDDSSDDRPAGNVRAAGGETGPWDAGLGYPQRERVDLGSLLIPVIPGVEVQLNINEEQIVAATVNRGGSTLQVQALAAPKSGGLWDDMRGDIAADIASQGGEAAEAEGTFGTELVARIPADPGSGLTGLQPARFIGVDGPRWMLHAVLKGQAADRADAAQPMEEIFADIVVVRGEHPAPPRDLLEIRLPAELRQAMEEEMARAEASAQAEQRRKYPSPFERGPEITETR